MSGKIATLPARPAQLELLPDYQAAREMIERVVRVDEAKSIADRATALRAYAIKARDYELLAMAKEMQLRAGRKAGQLLDTLEGQGKLAKRGKRASRQMSGTVTFTLDDYGITRNESMVWRRLWRIAEQDFEQQIFRLHNPTQQNPFFSSDSDEWLTPRAILDRAVSCLGQIDLDPCAEAGKSNVPAARHISRDEDALNLDLLWQGTVFMNPPYGKLIDRFCAKLADMWRMGAVESAIALVPARTDTAWFQHFKDLPVCFVFGRLIFRRVGGLTTGQALGAPFPSALFYLGVEKSRFLRAFSEVGQIRDAAIAG